MKSFGQNFILFIFLVLFHNTPFSPKCKEEKKLTSPLDKNPGSG
jgi:hypothetical protein